MEEKGEEMGTGKGGRNRSCLCGRECYL